MSTSKTQKLYHAAKQLIPGGTQLLSKRPEMFLPGAWPAYYRKARGCEVWDLDGKKYVDMSYMGIGACVLGYADPDVNRAVKRAVDAGSMSTLNVPEEVALAQEMLRLHPWAAQVRFARSGGEAMSLAVRIARAYTGKEIVLFCGYHGWHDWYLASNIGNTRSLDGHLLPGLNPLGVPRSLKGTAHPFTYNDTKEFVRLMRAHAGSVAAIVMESIRNNVPDTSFLSTIRKMSATQHVPLIFDEITAGWRLNNGGAHLTLGVHPDIAVFAKAISNGYPMAAIIGTEKVMQVAQDSFISSTYWTERIGPAAALATIEKYRKFKVHQHLARMGKMVQEGWKAAATNNGLDIHVGGLYPLSHFSFTHSEPLVLKTLFTQWMLDRGFLATTAFYASYAHKETHVRKYLAAVDAVFDRIARAVASGNPRRCLKGPVCHAGFKRLT